MKVFFLAVLVLLSSSSVHGTMEWEPRSSYDTTVNQLLGRHHPIVFANETHAFLLGGSTRDVSAAADFYIYDEAADQWTDHTVDALRFPPRSFGYGVVLNQANHPKAYLGFGADLEGERLNDLWEFDMTTLEFRQLASCPGPGRRHPSMVPVFVPEENKWQIHVGLGDGYTPDFSNFNDYWLYDIETDQWTQLPDFPSSRRHHPFFFGMGDTSFTGLGHSDGSSPYIERDFYSYSTTEGWTKEPDFESYALDDGSLQTTEARVAGTEFSIELPVRGATTDDSSNLEGAIGFVLSGDGSDHRSMPQGEFHAFYPADSPLLSDGEASMRWRQLTPHPGGSRWAPGSFVMRGTARAYFTSGYDRATNQLPSDVWRIDLSSLFHVLRETGTTSHPVDTAAAEETGDTATEGQDTASDEGTEVMSPEAQDATSDEGQAETPPSGGDGSATQIFTSSGTRAAFTFGVGIALASMLCSS